MLSIEKLLKKSGIDLKSLIDDSKEVPDLLKVLVEHSNAQTRAVNEMTKRISEFQEKMDKKITELRENVDAILERQEE